MNRIRAGQLLTRNPVNHSQIYRVALSPDTVDCIVFWTKDPQNLMPYLDELDTRGYKYYFQFTLTPYGRDIEPGLRPKEDIIETFISLSERIGSLRTVWRYDPVILTDAIGIDYHREHFARLCDRLAGAKKYTDTVVISFVDVYPKIKSDAIRELEPEEMCKLAEIISKTAHEHGLRVKSCCEELDLSEYGVSHGACISASRIEKICGCTLNIPPEKNQRPRCGCRKSIDIGAYNTCVNGCVYCYATGLMSTATARNRSHDPEGELLIGRVGEDETVVDRSDGSYRLEQLSLF